MITSTTASNSPRSRRHLPVAALLNGLAALAATAVTLIATAPAADLAIVQQALLA